VVIYVLIYVLIYVAKTPQIPGNFYDIYVHINHHNYEKTEPTKTNQLQASLTHHMGRVMAGISPHCWMKGVHKSVSKDMQRGRAKGCVISQTNKKRILVCVMNMAT